MNHTIYGLTGAQITELQGKPRLWRSGRLWYCGFRWYGYTVGPSAAEAYANWKDFIK